MKALVAQSIRTRNLALMVATLCGALVTVGTANAAGLKEQALNKVLSQFLTVTVSPEYPNEQEVFENIAAKELKVVKESKQVVFTPADAAEYDVTLADVYLNIKDAVDRLDIFTVSTRVYIPGGKIKKDQTIAIATTLMEGVISTSYEDVAEYVELTTFDGGSFFRVVVSTRQENVVDGNYDVTLEYVAPGTADERVILTYVKRQNLVGTLAWINASFYPPEDYVVSTRASVENTIARLSAFGFGYEVPAPMDEAPWCELVYETTETGCDYEWNGCPSGYNEVSSSRCKLSWWDWGWTGRDRTCQKPTGTTCNFDD